MYTPYRTYRIYCFYFNHIRSSAKNQPIFLSSFLNFALLFTTRIKNPHSRFLRKCGFNFYGFIRFSYGLKRIGPLGKRLFVHAVHDLALFPVRVRAHGFKAVKRFAHTAAAGGRKWNHRLAGKIVLLKERIDDCRRHIPPGMSANPTITGNLLIHTFHCRLKSHSWKRFWDYDTFVV